MLSPFVSGIKLLNEDIIPGHISLVSAKEGPLGATLRLSFAVEILVDQEDIENAAASQGITPEDIKAPDKAANMEDLVAALHYEDMAPALYDRMIKYGIEDVVDKITEDDFMQLLHFLREQGKTDIALKIKRPDYWSNVKTYVDNAGNEQEVLHTDYRAAANVRGTDVYTQKALSGVWSYLLEQSQDQVIDQVVDLFAEFPPEWQNIIFGKDLNNVNIQMYKGNEKFDDPETKGHDAKCQCKKCKEYKESWHYGYRTQEEMQGRVPYAHEQEKWQRLATQVKKLVEKLERKVKRAKTQEEKEYYTTRLADLRKKGEHLVDKMMAVPADIAASGKKVIFAYVTVDLEPFVEIVQKLFYEHLDRQDDDVDYAKATQFGKSKNGQLIEKWPSGLAGLKDFMISMGKLSHDTSYGGGIYNEIVDVIETGMGDTYGIVDLDNNGNILYVNLENQVLDKEMPDITPAVRSVFGGDEPEPESEKGGHETEPRGKLSRKPTWAPQTWGGSAKRDRSQSESIEKIAKSLT